MTKGRFFGWEICDSISGDTRSSWGCPHHHSVLKKLGNLIYWTLNHLPVKFRRFAVWPYKLCFPIKVAGYIDKRAGAGWKKGGGEVSYLRVVVDWLDWGKEWLKTSWPWVLRPVLGVHEKTLGSWRCKPPPFSVLGWVRVKFGHGEVSLHILFCEFLRRVRSDGSWSRFKNYSLLFDQWVHESFSSLK